MKEPQEEAGESGFILPIICPKCMNQIELSVAFKLLPPKQNPEQDSIIDITNKQ